MYSLFRTSVLSWQAYCRVQYDDDNGLLHVNNECVRGDAHTQRSRPDRSFPAAGQGSITVPGAIAATSVETPIDVEEGLQACSPKTASRGFAAVT